MFRRILSLLIGFPLGIILVAIAISNRQPVDLILDPFRPETPALSIELPFYIYLMTALIIGVVLGGLATWMGQSRWRQTARSQGRRARAGRPKRIASHVSAKRPSRRRARISRSRVADTARTSMTFDALTLYGLVSVSLMLLFYAFEDNSPWCIPGFAVACAMGSVYGFLQGAWPFGLVEGVWTFIALQRWQKRRLLGKPTV